MTDFYVTLLCALATGACFIASMCTFINAIKEGMSDAIIFVMGLLLLVVTVCFGYDLGVFIMECIKLSTGTV